MKGAGLGEGRTNNLHFLSIQSDWVEKCRDGNGG